MKLIMLGAPGSGKGTQAKLLAKDLKLKHVSSDILRKEIKKGTNMGKIFKEYMDRGDLIPDNLINKFVIKNMPKNNFILDGYPRRIKEAEFLDEKNKPEKVVFLKVNYNILKKRLLKRAKI